MKLLKIGNNDFDDDDTTNENSEEMRPKMKLIVYLQCSYSVKWY